ncbi:hypothetical protein QUW58_23310 [Enterocloster aldenensis]|uniref:hypothetical protein n=1 Tax=Enterocloster aldenensis TaxID=358742 RepID=UPI0025A43F4E|nr:hypothetical protein [Enterocloster aldenensis]
MERKRWDIDVQELLERITPGRVDETVLEEDTEYRQFQEETRALVSGHLGAHKDQFGELDRIFTMENRLLTRHGDLCYQTGFKDCLAIFRMFFMEDTDTENAKEQREEEQKCDS